MRSAGFSYVQTPHDHGVRYCDASSSSSELCQPPASSSSSSSSSSSPPPPALLRRLSAPADWPPRTRPSPPLLVHTPTRGARPDSSPAPLAPPIPSMASLLGSFCLLLFLTTLRPRSLGRKRKGSSSIGTCTQSQSRQSDSRLGRWRRDTLPDSSRPAPDSRARTMAMACRAYRSTNCSSRHARIRSDSVPACTGTAAPARATGSSCRSSSKSTTSASISADIPTSSRRAARRRAHCCKPSFCCARKRKYACSFGSACGFPPRPLPPPPPLRGAPIFCLHALVI